MEEEGRGGFTLHSKTGKGSQHITLVKMNKIQHKMNGIGIKKKNVMTGCLGEVITSQSTIKID